MNIPVEIKEDNLIDSLKREMSNEELKNFVLKLDLLVGEADFTENLIKSLVECLARDLMKDERESLLEDISQKLEKGFEDYH